MSDQDFPDSDFFSKVENLDFLWNPIADDLFFVSILTWIMQLTICQPFSFLAFCLTALIIASLLRDLYRRKWLHMPPGPLSLPFIGGLYGLNRKKPHICLKPLVKKYGKMLTIQMAMDGPAVFVNEINLAIHLLKDVKLANRPFVPIFKHLCGGSLDCIGAIPYGMKWKREQKMLHAALMDTQNMALDHHLSYTMDLLFKWLNTQNGKTFNPAQMCENIMVLFQNSCIYGRQYESMEDPCFLQQTKSLADAMKCLEPDHLINIFPWLWYVPCESTKHFKHFLEERDAFLDEQVKNQKNGKCSLNNVLNHMLNAEQDKISETEIKICAWTMDIGGSTTLSCTLNWLLLYLAHNPAIQKKVQQETDHLTSQTYNTSGKNNTPLTDAVVMETLRISPPNPFAIPHMASDDIHVEDYVIPKGTTVLVNIWEIHHDKAMWDDPMSFRPERFLEENGQTVSAKTMKNFMPFAGGARPCIGRRIAYDFARMFAISFFKQYNVTLGENNPTDFDFEGVMAFGLSPSPYEITITRRN